MRCTLAALTLLLTGFAGGAPAVADVPHNVILFVPDGLRAQMVSAETAPAMAALRDRGVDFRNPHALFPTFTTPNASAMATGHYLGDTGEFGNTIYSGFPVPGAGGSLTPFMESDPVLGDVDEHYAGDYLDETTVLKAARAKGFGTAAIGKLGPTLIFDHTDRSGAPTIIIDDSTGSAARHPAGAGGGRGAAGGGPAAGGAVARRQWPRRRCDDTRHQGRQCRPAGLVRRGRNQGGAAHAEGQGPALRDGVLVARSRRHAA